MIRLLVAAARARLRRSLPGFPFCHGPGEIFLRHELRIDMCGGHIVDAPLPPAYPNGRIGIAAVAR